MNLTLTQTAEHMQESKGHVRRLIADGTLTDLKANGAKGKRHMFLIDSKQVKAYMKALNDKRKENGHVPVRRRTPVTVPAGPSKLYSVTDRLDRIERKIDQLIAVWS